MLELRPNQDVDVAVNECFSLDNETCIIFQKYDEDWGNLSMHPCGGLECGDMIACEHKDCLKEWFHFQCVGLSTAPSGEWFCEQCKGVTIGNSP